jgi:hypothetical protein
MALTQQQQPRALSYCPARVLQQAMLLLMKLL